MRFLAEVQRHHSHCNENYKWLWDEETYDKALVSAIAEVLDEGWGLGLVDDGRTTSSLAEPIAAALAKLPLGGHVTLEISNPDNPEEYEGWHGVLWWSNHWLGINESEDGEPDHTDKYHTRWLRVGPWEPNKQKLEELLKLSKEELAALILEHEATK